MQNLDMNLNDPLTREGAIAGITSAGITAAVLSPIVYMLDKRMHSFRTSMGVSGKVATVVIPAAYMFYHSSHLTVMRGRSDLGSYMALREQTIANNAHYYSLPLHQKAANWLYDHPFAFVTGTGVTAVSTIFALEKMNHPTLSLSSRVMHTRVYAQGIVVAILCSTMFFHDYMNRHGRFLPAGVTEQPRVSRHDDGEGMKLATLHVDHAIAKRFTPKNTSATDPTNSRSPE